MEEATRTTETDMDTNSRGWSAPSEHRTTYRLAPGTGLHYLEETHEDSYAIPRGILLMMMMTMMVTITLPYPNPNVTWAALPPKSNGFFRGPCATSPPNFVKKNMLSKFCVILLANKQTNTDENITSLAEVISSLINRSFCFHGRSFGPRYLAWPSRKRCY